MNRPREAQILRRAYCHRMAPTIKADAISPAAVFPRWPTEYAMLELGIFSRTSATRAAAIMAPSEARAACQRFSVREPRAVVVTKRASARDNCTERTPRRLDRIGKPAWRRRYSWTKNKGSKIKATKNNCFAARSFHHS